MSMLSLTLALSLPNACTGTKGDSSTSESDTDTDTDSDSDTDANWEDHSLETSESLTDLWSYGTTIYATSTGGKVCRYDVGSNTWAIDGDTLPCWEDLNPEDSDINGIWGTGDASAPILFTVSDGGYIQQYSGGVWSAATDVDVGFANLESVDGGDASSLTAVSWAGIYNNNDGDWANVTVLTGNPQFNHVWSDGTLSIAVGENGYIGNYGGGSWTLSQDSSFRTLYGVHGLSYQDAWAVGAGGAALHWDGASWTTFDAPVDGSLWAVWMVATDSVYAVGSNGDAVHWDGTEWSVINTGANNNLYAVHATDDNGVWASGNRGALFHYMGPAAN